MFDLDLIQDSSERAYLKRMAIDSVINFVARTMSTSQFRFRQNKKTLKKEWDFVLNARPNKSKSAADFWHKFFYKLIIDNEILIILSDDNQLNEGNRRYGFSLGYIADKTNSKNTDRLANAGIYWGLRSSKKSYPVAIGGIIANPGDYFSFQSLRNYLSSTEAAEAINLNIVTDQKDVYLYADLIDVVGTINKHLPDEIGKEILKIQDIGLVLKNQTVDAAGIVFGSNGNGNGIFKAT